MATPKSRIEANKNYENRNYDRILARFPQGTKAKIAEAAREAGESVNNFIVNATCDRIGIDRPVLKELKTLNGKRAEQAEKIEKVQLMDEEYYDDELPFANDQEPVDLQALQELLEEKRKQFQAKEPGWMK